MIPENVVINIHSHESDSESDSESSSDSDSDSEVADSDASVEVFDARTPRKVVRARNVILTCLESCFALLGPSVKSEGRKGVISEVWAEFAKSLQEVKGLLGDEKVMAVHGLRNCLGECCPGLVRVAG